MAYFCNFFVLFTTLVTLSPVFANNFYAEDDRPVFPKRFVGSNLFGDGKFIRKCFSMEDVAVLATRSKFEAFVPNFTSGNDLENDRSVEKMLEYLQGISGLVNQTDRRHNVQYITQAAYYDVIGGYLHFFYLPFVKFSFYAGTLNYGSALKVYNFQSNCKQFLNTRGNGWRISTFKFLGMKYRIQPINTQYKGLETETKDLFKDPCENLLLASDDDYTSDYSDNELIVSLPRIQPVDDDNVLSVWLPFKDKRNFILNSKSSAFVLTRYYVDVLKCYQFRNVMSNPFNRRFQKLLNEKVLPFIHNDEFYPGFGAILRVWETLKGSSVHVRSAYKLNFDSEATADELWDDSVDGSFSNLLVRDVDQTNQSKSGNEPDFVSKMLDSIKKFQADWNQKQKNKYICIAVIVLVIGLLIVLVCVLINREKRSTGVNRSTLTRERENNWKTLLRKLSGTTDKSGLETGSEIKLTKHEGTTSAISDTASTRPTNSQFANNWIGRSKKVKNKALNDMGYSSSSSSTMSDTTKSKQRRICRKIRNELKQSRYSHQSVTTSHVPLNKNLNFKFKKKMNEVSPKKGRCKIETSESEKERNSSSWETLSSSKVTRKYHKTKEIQN